MTQPTSANETKCTDMEAGEFWFKTIANPTLWTLGVSGHAVGFAAVGIASKFLPVGLFGLTASHYASLRLFLGGLSAFMAGFALLLSATMAHSIVENRAIQPRGFGEVTIAQTTATAVAHVLSAFVLLVLLR